MKLKLVEINHEDGIRYVVQYKMRWYHGWRYVQTYQFCSPSDYGIHCLDELSGESTMRGALEAIIDYFNGAEGKVKPEFKTLNEWKSFEDMEASLISMPSNSNDE